MIRSFLASLLIIAFYFSLSDCAFSQSTEGESTTGDSQQPAVNRGESEPPWYYYWPDENLNPFGLSSLGNEGGGSTLGKSTERRSNLQVNPPTREQNQYDVQGDDITKTPPVEDTLSSQESIQIGSPSRPAKKGPIYQWVDEKGVKHVTNDIGSVPPEYLKEISTDNKQDRIE